MVRLISALGRGFLAPLAVLALAGCMDIELDVTALDAATARSTTTATMGADVFAVLAAEDAAFELDALCHDVVPLSLKGPVTCSTTFEGPFGLFPADFTGEPLIVFQTAGLPEGRVRIALSATALSRDAAQRAGGVGDPQAAALIDALFSGHDFTFSVTGAAVHATNMQRDEDGRAARVTIPLNELLSGNLDLPPSYYATIDLP